MNTYQIDNYTFKQTIDSATINKKIIEIANQINVDYQNKSPLFLITLTGGMFFGIELLKYIKLKCKCNVISAKSYGKEMKSSGNVTIEMFDCEIKNEDIILIEDIVDTGLTMTKIIKEIQKQNPASLSIATLINKPICNEYKLTLDYVGFNLGKEFIIGYGLDYKGYGRNLDSIYSL
jgi:hypoxanthine phosphoribosyltransferase